MFWGSFKGNVVFILIVLIAFFYSIINKVDTWTQTMLKVRLPSWSSREVSSMWFCKCLCLWFSTLSLPAIPFLYCALSPSLKSFQNNTLAIYTMTPHHHGNHALFTHMRHWFEACIPFFREVRSCLEPFRPFFMNLPNFDWMTKNIFYGNPN